MPPTLASAAFYQKPFHPEQTKQPRSNNFLTLPKSILDQTIHSRDSSTYHDGRGSFVSC
jgi:hypothetical protein